MGGCFRSHSYPLQGLDTFAVVTDDAELLPLAEVDLESLVLARNDGHPDGDWWFDPRSGSSLYHGLDDDSDLPALVEGVHVLIPYDPQPRSYIDEFFTVVEELGVDDDTIAELYGAYRGKGGLRRFRERVGSTAASEVWSRFAFDREAERAIAWLRERGLVASDPEAG